ncbi:MAG: response regulator [Anaerolineae bacterium]|nr:response regulator [Anaerolineae bacterium]
MPTVLVVEDDIDLLFLYHTVLSQKGYDVVEARNSTQAMELLEAPDFIPHLVFIDMGMPDAPGTRPINYMRSEPRFDNTRIVVVTANEQYRERINENDISHFLVKPVSIAELIAVAAELTA